LIRRHEEEIGDHQSIRRQTVAGWWGKEHPQVLTGNVPIRGSNEVQTDDLMLQRRHRRHEQHSVNEFVPVTFVGLRKGLQIVYGEMSPSRCHDALVLGGAREYPFYLQHQARKNSRANCAI
jgi:hypothetical protein